jgi:diguanylate cyclase (GGDEF)-like protein
LAIERENTLRNTGRALALLIAAALGAILFIAIATLLGFRVTRNLISNHDWVEHSDQVILTLQEISARVDRMDSTARLEQLSDDPGYQRSLLIMARIFQDNSRHLQMTVHNPQQIARAKALLMRADRVLDAVQPSSPQHSALLPLLLSCQESIAQMTDAEEQLLQDRQNEAHQSNYRIALIGFIYVNAAVFSVFILFGLLFRDAWRRQRSERLVRETNLQLEKTVRSLEHNAEEATLLIAAREELQLCVSVNEVYVSAARYFQRLLPDTSGALCILNNSWQCFEIASNWNAPRNLISGFSLDSCCGMRSGRLRWRKPGDSEVHCGHFDGTPPDNYLCMQLSAYGETLGILYLECPTAASAARVADRLLPLQNLAELVSLSAASLNLRARLENQSIRDGLTNLFNRHFMEIALERELRRAARQHQQVAVIMLDVDHFKTFNDTYGHEAGDMVLREVSACLTANNRSEDMVCRYGGEEFVIILPEITTELALERANLLRRLVHDIALRYRGAPLRPITISAGVAIYPQRADTMEQLLRLADRALYEAKNTGRDRVVLAESDIAATA